MRVSTRVTSLVVSLPTACDDAHLRLHMATTRFGLGTNITNITNIVTGARLGRRWGMNNLRTRTIAFATKQIK